MNTYDILISWQVARIVHVQAESLDDALSQAREMPATGTTEYVENSFDAELWGKNPDDD